MTDEGPTREWVKALFGPVPRVVEPSPDDDPMCQFTRELFGQEDQ